MSQYPVRDACILTLLRRPLPLTLRLFVNGTDNFYFNGADGKTEAVCLSQYSSSLTYNLLANGENIGQVKVDSETPTRYYYLKDPRWKRDFAPWQCEDDSRYKWYSSWL